MYTISLRIFKNDYYLITYLLQIRTIAAFVIVVIQPVILIEPSCHTQVVGGIMKHDPQMTLFLIFGVPTIRLACCLI